MQVRAITCRATTQARWYSLAKLSKEIDRQVAMLGYINAFGFYTLASALAIPLILFVGRRARAR